MECANESSDERSGATIGSQLGMLAPKAGQPGIGTCCGEGGTTVGQVGSIRMRSAHAIRLGEREAHQKARLEETRTIVWVRRSRSRLGLRAPFRIEYESMVRAALSQQHLRNQGVW